MSIDNQTSSKEGSLKDEFYDLKDQVNLISNIVGEISKTDQALTKQTIHLLTENIKVLVNNQQVLENKLDDTLKNQFNTDQVVNELNWKVTRLLQLTALDLSNNITESKKITTSKITAVNSSTAKPSNTVQVDGSKITITNKDMANSLNSTVTKLPIKHNIPKSKRYFHDPVSNKRLLSVDSNASEQNGEQGTKEANHITDNQTLATISSNTNISTNAISDASTLPGTAKVPSPVVNNIILHDEKLGGSSEDPPMKKTKLNDSGSFTNGNAHKNT